MQTGKRAPAASLAAAPGSRLALSAASPVCALSPDVARKIAAGEVIDRPCAIVRELIDNAIDSEPSAINVEITGGGIDSIRVQDDGSGMTKEDLARCARPHATSKIKTDTDLLKLSTMGFRGEALASIAAVSKLTITSGGFRMKASLDDDHIISPAIPIQGTAVMAEGLFENFPARRHFLKRPAAEGAMCRAMFIEKAMSRPDIKFTLAMDGEREMTLPVCTSSAPLKDRFVDVLGIRNLRNSILPPAGTWKMGRDILSPAITSGQEALFHEVKGDSGDGDWSFTAVLGDPAVYRPTRREIYIYVNGRRIQEYSLVQAIEYGAMGFFPNGTFPVAALFAVMKAQLVDFNIHPAKKEARFQNIAPLHHGVSTAVRAFYTNGAGAIEKIRAKKQQDTEQEKIDGTLQSERQSTPQGAEEKMQGNAKDIYPSLAASRLTPAKQAIVQYPPSAVNYSAISARRPMAGAVHFLGVALGVFLVAEKDNVLYLIDQHAAHERILYDQMMAGGDRQPLLVPYVIAPQSDADDEYLLSIAPALTAAGFDTRRANGNSLPSERSEKTQYFKVWQVWSTPALWRGGEADFAHAVLDEKADADEIIRRAAAAGACKDAVKDGTYLDEQSAKDLAEAALSLPDPHCPHGRPLWCALSREELFSWVRRT